MFQKSKSKKTMGLELLAHVIRYTCYYSLFEQVPVETAVQAVP